MEIYQNTLGLLASGQDVPDCSEFEQEKTSNRSEIICLAVETIARFLIHRRRESLQVLLARTGIVDFLIMLLFDAKVFRRNKNPEKKRESLILALIFYLFKKIADSGGQAHFGCCHHKNANGSFT